MAQQLRILIDKKVQFISNVFSELDIYFTQFDQQCQFIEDLLFSFFQFDKNDVKQIDDQQQQDNLHNKQKSLQHSMSLTQTQKKVQKTHSLSFVDLKESNKQNQLKRKLRQGEAEMNQLRNLFFSLINKIDHSHTKEELKIKNENLKQKKKILNEQIENLKSENSYLKIEIAMNKEQESINYQKSYNTLIQDNIELEQFNKIKEENTDLQKENYFLKLQIETTQTELIQAQKNIQQLQKKLQIQQEEFIALLKAPQKISNSKLQDDLFQIPEDQIPEKPVTFDEISNIQHVRQKSDIDPGLIDKLIGQNDELIASFNQNAQDALLEEVAFKPMNFKMQKTIKRNTTLDLDFKDAFEDLEKNQLNEMFFDSELMLFKGQNKLSRIYSQNEKNLSNYNSLKRNHQSSQLMNKIGNNIQNNLSKKIISKNKSSIEFRKELQDQNILKGFNDLGSFRTPIVQDEAKSGILRKSLSSKNDNIRKIDSEILKLEQQKFQQDEYSEEENDFLDYHYKQILQQDEFDDNNPSYIQSNFSK